jgi:cytochrome b subunit of formate dehydrogenase
MKKDRFILAGLLGALLLAPVLVLHAQSRSDCLTCHSDTSLSKEREGKQVSLFVAESVLDHSPHRKLLCVACHTGFNPDNVPHKEKIEPVKCLTCHGGVQVKHTFHPQLAASLAAHEEPDVSCKDCHGAHDVASPKIPGTKFHESNLTQSCGECHGDVKETFTQSAHGQAIAAGVTGAPNCLTCHRHDIAGAGPTRDTLSQKIAQEKLCLSCHLDNPDVRARTSPTAGFIAAYEKSVHGTALNNGNARAANCVDCHGNHEMRKGSDQASFVNRKKIPETCGKCHAEIAAEFQQSVHGAALARGNTDAPSCTNCHGEHTIFAHKDPRSSVAAGNVSAQCATCHGSVRLSEKYGIASSRPATFSDTYHGLAMKGGSVDVANCASCHGAHNIKPASDPASTVNKANLAATCGKCHPGANQKFAMGSVHVQMTSADEPMLYWIATVYLILIVVVIGGMVVHNLLDFLKKSRRKLAIRGGQVLEEHGGHSLYLRMTLNERLQHGALTFSFVMLVITGFMLRYPDAWWVAGIRNLSDHVFELRGILHRIAATLLVSAGLYHLYYVAGTSRGRKFIRDLMPGLQDARDAVGIMKYNLGISAQKPKLGRFSYVEKSEYWALVWGTLVMGITGAMMWFDNTFIGLFTKLGYDVARTIHFYEAWLATLAILVWHFYFVIFNPDAYPMNMAWLKGTLTETEMEEDHPLELEEILNAEGETISSPDGSPKSSAEKGDPETDSPEADSAEADPPEPIARETSRRRPA